MKSSQRIKYTFGLGSILALSLALGLSASGGTESSAKQPTDVSGPKHVDSPASMACPKCKTEIHEEFSVTKLGGEWVYRTTGVGTKHTCDTCGGRITAIRGKTYNAMMDYCPICAKAGPNCCTISNKVASN